MRKIKVLQFTYDQVSKGEIEEKINNTIEDLTKENKKIVTINTETFGFSPAILLYNIIYEEM